MESTANSEFQGFSATDWKSLSPQDIQQKCGIISDHRTK